MKRILVVTPYERDASSFWRCMGPMTYLQNHSNGQIQITLSQMTSGIAWCDLMQYDLVFLHRPCRPDDLTVMKIAHNLGIPCWIDYDDWLFNVPSWNGTSQTYNNPGLQNIMAQCLVSADMISCSTDELDQKFKLVNPNVIVLKNAYRSDLYPYRRDELQPRNSTAYWRGSHTHDGDLLSVKDGFTGINGQLLFLGGISWMLLSTLPPDSYRVVQSQDVIMYYKYIYDLNAKVCVFPLVDCFFNRCKSNIAYIEAMHAGSLCVAPNMPEWRREGVITYTPHDSDSFREAVNYVLELPNPQHEGMVFDAFKSMKSEYDIPMINEIRQRVTLTLTKDTTRPSPFDQLAALNAIAVLKGEKNAND